MPIDMSLTPHAVTGISIPFRFVGWSWTPKRRGSEKP